MIFAAVITALCILCSIPSLTKRRLNSFNVGDLIAITGGEHRGRIGVVTGTWKSMMTMHKPMQYNGVSFDLQHKGYEFYRGDATVWQVKKIG